MTGHRDNKLERGSAMNAAYMFPETVETIGGWYARLTTGFFHWTDWIGAYVTEQEAKAALFDIYGAFGHDCRK